MNRRLPAIERRATLIDAATRAFAAEGYRACSVASIAEQAGVSAPIVYRHFATKGHLFAGCLEHEAALLFAAWDELLAAEPPREQRLLSLAQAFLAGATGSSDLISLWFQAIAEMRHDEVVRDAFDSTLRDVHAYVTSVVDGARGPDGFAPELVPEVEAWIFLAIGTLASADARAGGAMAPDLAALHEQRMRWLTHRA